MNHTFYLKEPKSKKKSLIYFSCSFKDEGKKFVYSTGEKISPKHWSFENNKPKLKGSSKDPNSSSIQFQLSRYSKTFEATVGLSKVNLKVITSKELRDAFDKEFKKTIKGSTFFDVFDFYTEEKKKRKEWSQSTLKRYKNIKNHLIAFEIKRKYKLTFSKINKVFYGEFLDYCYTDLNHYSNTLSRNIGLFKSFMYWALENGFTYNSIFKEFEKPKTVITDEVALSLEQIKEIFNLELGNKKDIQVRDVFVFQCLTGLRYGEMKLINENIVNENAIHLKEEKDVSKETREIPLIPISNFILKKYNFKLPLISNQKQNEYIKNILENAGFDEMTEYTRVKGVEVTKYTQPFYKRISTHTARRTFVTIMRNKGLADKTIMSITGHKDLKTFNMYHKVNTDAKRNAVLEAFGSMELPNLKRA